MNEDVSVFKGFVNKIEDKSLEEILNDVKIGAYRTKICDIRTLIDSDNIEKADQLKKQLIGFTVSGTFSNGRSIDKVKTYSQYVILDIDKLSGFQLRDIIHKTRLVPYTYASFVSPSGNGLKIIVKVNSAKEYHKEAYNQVAAYYEQSLNVEIDTSGSDICRLCFVSYDKDCFINKKADTFDVILKINSEAKGLLKNSNTKENKQLTIDELLDRCLKFTEQKEQYIEGNRNNFIFLFASNACRFGLKEANTYDFCFTNFDLNENEIKTSIRSAYKSNQQDFAKFANVVCKKEFELDTKQSIENLSVLASTPLIPNSVYENLPELFRKGVEYLKDNREKDVFLTGALSIISGCLPNVTGSYSGKVVSPNLYSFILAPAASGKGSLNFAKILADKYHQEVISASKLAAKEFNQEMEVHKHAKKHLKKGEQPPEAPEEPPFKTVYIPANTSNAKIIKHIQDNEGCGIICETEADTLGQTFKNDWGSYSDLLRKAYHHEKISISRKTNNEYYEIDNPGLSVVLSGTPNQILDIIQSAEDGLFSRFIFYVFSSNPVWLDPSPKSNPVNLTDHFKQLSDDTYRMVKFLETTTTNIHLPHEQWEKFNSLFDDYLHRIHNLVSQDATSIVKRLGLIVYRFCMIFTSMRKFENQLHNTDLVCTDIDFENALILADVYLQHSLLIYKNLPSQGTNIEFKPIDAKMNFYKKLPKKFARKDAVKLGEELTIKKRTVDNYLEKLVDEGFLFKPKAGYYIKLK